MKPPVATQVAAYRKVIQAVLDGTVNPVHQASLPGPCVYDGTHIDGTPNYCGVGALFNDAQRADIKHRGLNTNTGIRDLASKIGVANIVNVTGLPISSLEALQTMHDTLASKAGWWCSPASGDAAKSELIKYCERRIKRISR